MSLPFVRCASIIASYQHFENPRVAKIINGDVIPYLAPGNLFHSHEPGKN